MRQYIPASLTFGSSLAPDAAAWRKKQVARICKTPPFVAAIYSCAAASRKRVYCPCRNATVVGDATAFGATATAPNLRENLQILVKLGSSPSSPAAVRVRDGNSST